MDITRIVLLDDHQLFLDSLKVALSREPDLTVVGEAPEARRAYGLIEVTKPHVLVTDLMLKDTDGVSVCRELRRRGLSTPTLILSMHSNREFVREAFEAGARGYALKDEPLAALMSAVRTVAAGQRYLAPHLEDPAVQAESRSDASAGTDMLKRLSRREQEVFYRVIDGLPSRDIARVLSISLKTVETHRTRINQKLDVHSPAELTRLAVMAGLVAGSRAPRSSAGPDETSGGLET
jgi:DNA-binding NarL/FixJ family response regulator